MRRYMSWARADSGRPFAQADRSPAHTADDGAGMPIRIVHNATLDADTVCPRGRSRFVAPTAVRTARSRCAERPHGAGLQQPDDQPSPDRLVGHRRTGGCQCELCAYPNTGFAGVAIETASGNIYVGRYADNAAYRWWMANQAHSPGSLVSRAADV